MKIGIDASRAFSEQRTGIEEYSYRVIEHLIDKLKGHQVILYTRLSTKELELPKNWKIKIIRWPRLWTQIGLSLELLLHPVDVLFVPAHIVPLIHPKNTIVTIHGLEYEVIPEAYSAWEKLYMRASMKMSCRVAKKIIAVSRNTKNDLMRLYDIPEDKIEVVYEGISRVTHNTYRVTQNSDKYSTFQVPRSTPYLLFIGRLEKRKNIEGIISAFEILKEKYKIPHELVLAGKFGHGENDIRLALENSRYKNNIILPGFISEEEKWEYLKNADIFLFPTFYEGFGLPVLEAQSQGIPVIASNTSSLPEVAGEGALYVDPDGPDFIAETVYMFLSDEKLRNDMIEKGYENVKRFDWKQCAQEVAEILIKK
jgi:glycosyltransferase involved in cell wall biosynthesis